MNGYFKELLELYPNALVVRAPDGKRRALGQLVRATIGRNAMRVVDRA